MDITAKTRANPLNYSPVPANQDPLQQFAMWDSPWERRYRQTYLSYPGQTQDSKYPALSTEVDVGSTLVGPDPRPDLRGRIFYAGVALQISEDQADQIDEDEEYDEEELRGILVELGIPWDYPGVKRARHQ